MKDVPHCIIPALSKSFDKVTVRGPSNICYDQTVISSCEMEKQDFFYLFLLV